MKYFAKLGLNSKVVSLTHIIDSNAPTEKEGIEFLHKQTNWFIIHFMKNIAYILKIGWSKKEHQFMLSPLYIITNF